MRAICLGARVPYVPLSDRDVPPAEQTTFFLKPLSGREFALFTTPEPSEKVIEVWERVLKTGLLGWKNLLAPDGTQVPDTRPALEVLDPPLIEELVTAIFEAARVSRADQGKSSSPSGAASAGSAPSATPA